MNLTNVLIVIGSILFVTTYLFHVGWKSSISATAKDYMDEESRSPKFFWWFIMPLTIPMIYVANRPIFLIAGLTLTAIGLFTGYNIHFFKKKIQDIIHVGCVYTAIGLFWLGLYLLTPWSLIGTIPVVLATIWMLIKKPKYYTYKIEVLIIIQIWITFLILNL